MEEILASIRRIIADDQTGPGKAGSSTEPPSDLRAPNELQKVPIDEVPNDEVPMSSEVAAENSSRAEPDPEGGPPSRHGIATPSFESGGSVMDHPHPLSPRQERADTASIEVTPPVRDDDLHESALRDMHEEPESPSYDGPFDEPPRRDATSAVDSGRLISASTSQSLASAFNTLAVSRLVAESGALQGLAKDLLRPLLADWLDKHLPTMVESIIRDEIERMTRAPR